MIPPLSYASLNTNHCSVNDGSVVRFGPPQKTQNTLIYKNLSHHRVEFGKLGAVLELKGEEGSGVRKV